MKESTSSNTNEHHKYHNSINVEHSYLRKENPNNFIICIVKIQKQHQFLRNEAVRHSK